MKEVNIDNLDECTSQEVFDFIAHHLLTQRQKSEDDGTCMYLSSEGLKCAAGCLIPENRYSVNFETWCWDYLRITLNLTSKHDNLIEALQILHDYSKVDIWAEELEKVAMNFKLNPDIIKTLTS